MSEVSGNEAADRDEDGGREVNEHSIMYYPSPPHTHIRTKLEYLNRQKMNISEL